MCCDIGIVTSGPNEALVISGVFYGDIPTIIIGGRALVCPCLQKVQRIPLSTMTLIIESPRVYTSQGVPISVTGVAQVKINGSNDEMIRIAAEQFAGNSIEEISYVARETLEGHQRAIMGNMTVEGIYRDRKLFSQKVFEVASTDFYNMGISVISYTIKDITDDVGYLKALGEARTAEVQRDARIGEAIAKMEASIAEAKAEEQRLEAKFYNETEICRAKRDFDTKKADYDTQVNTASAESSLAFELQTALIQQKIKEEEQKIILIERIQQIELMEQEMNRKEKELDATIYKEADAEQFRLVTIANAHFKKVFIEAEAEAEAINLKSQAEAESMEAKGKAEAMQIELKAKAFESYRDAAKMEMILTALPKVVSEISSPLSKVNKIRMISDQSSEIGASKLSQEVISIVNQMPSLVHSMTGVDIFKRQ